MKLADYQALAGLDYFERDARGRLCLADGVAERIVDFHTHLGLSFLAAAPLDQDRRHDEVQTFFPQRGNPVDMEIYSAAGFTKEARRIAQVETLRQAYSTRGFASTHTARNLVDEMARLRVIRAVILAIDLPLRALSNNSEAYLAAARRYPQLIPFVSLHPYQPFMARRLRALHRAGGRGMKLHPPMQLVRPSARRCVRLFRHCGQLGLPCLLHTGHSDLSPDWQADYPAIEHLWAPVAQLPHTVFILGHAGIHQYEQAIALARAHANVYLELSGQPPHRIQRMLDAGLEDRMLFGSDWPYYPVALPLAKVLLATEGAVAVRQKLLFDNARALLGRIGVEV